MRHAADFLELSMHTSCYATVRSLELSMHTSCYATVSSLELSTHASCYATVSSLELSMHTSCYATVRSLELSMHASCYSTVRSLELSMHASCYACRFSWSFHSCVMLRYCRCAWTFHSCVRRWRKTCHVELVSESAKNPKMLVSSRRNACFEKLHQNKGLTALNITSNKFLFARAHHIWSMTPRWSQKTHGLLEAVLLVSRCRQNPSKPCWLIRVMLPHPCGILATQPESLSLAAPNTVSLLKPAQ